MIPAHKSRWCTVLVLAAGPVLTCASGAAVLRPAATAFPPPASAISLEDGRMHAFHAATRGQPGPVVTGRVLGLSADELSSLKPHRSQHPATPPPPLQLQHLVS